jgi:WD40 repeat protein
MRKRLRRIALAVAPLALVLAFCIIPWARNSRLLDGTIHTGLPVLAIATSETLLAIGRYDGQILIFEPAGRQRMTELHRHERPVIDLKFSTSGRWLCSVDSSGKCFLWDTESWSATAVGDPKSVAIRAAFSPSESALAVSAGFEVVCYDRESLKVLGSLSHCREIAGLAWRDDLTVIFVDDGGEVVSTGFREPKAAATIRSGVSRVTAFSYDPVHDKAVVGGADGTVMEVRARSGESLRFGYDTSDKVRAIAQSPNGALVAVAFGDPSNPWPVAWSTGYVVLFSAESRDKRLSYTWFWGAVLSLAFSADSRLVYSGATEGRLKIWRVEY